MLFSDFEELATILSSLSTADLAEPENIAIVQDVRSAVLLILEGAQSNPTAFPSDWISGVRNWSVII